MKKRSGGKDTEDFKGERKLNYIYIGNGTGYNKRGAWLLKRLRIRVGVEIPKTLCEDKVSWRRAKLSLLLSLTKSRTKVQVQPPYGGSSGSFILQGYPLYPWEKTD